jgi:Ca2+-binding RTX toxin-like protein
MSDTGIGTFIFDVGISDASYLGESRYDLDTYVWHYRDPSSQIGREFSLFVSFPNPSEVTVENIYFTDRSGRPTLDYYGGQSVIAYDDLVSDAPDWRFHGFGGPDTIIGNKYRDVIEGGNRGDLLSGMGGRDRLYGERGDDLLHGNAGRDRLFGGPGDDVLHGGGGRDMLAGGAGADTFEFQSPADAGRGKNRDAIVDFDRTEDYIDLRLIDANADRNGNQVFRFIGSDPFSDKAGELRFSHEILRGDTDGDGASEFQIAVHDITELRAVDLLL